MESVRQSRYLALGAFFGFFALSTPVMLKLLPAIIGSQMAGFPPELMRFDAVYSIQNYIKNIYQLGNMAVAFTLMGVLADERLGGKLVFPVSQGAGMVQVVAAKLLHYSVAVAGIVFATTMVNYYYSALLFPGGDPGWGRAVATAGLLAAYFITRVAVVVFASALFRKGLAAGLASLVFSYLEPIAVSFRWGKALAPYTLINLANAVLGPGTLAPGALGMGAGAGGVAAGAGVNEWLLAAAATVEVAALAALAVWRMRSIEIAPGGERA